MKESVETASTRRRAAGQSVTPTDHDFLSSWTEFVLAEYGSVRQEWLQAGTIQHSVFQWSVAAMAVLVGGILGFQHVGPSAICVAAAAFTLLSYFSLAVLIGEFHRMERAALYLRGLEVMVAGIPWARETRLPTPLSWECYRTMVPRNAQAPWIAKGNVVGASIATFYGLATASGLSYLFWLSVVHRSVLGYCVSSGLSALILATLPVLLVSSLRVLTMRDHAADIRSVDRPPTEVAR